MKSRGFTLGEILIAFFVLSIASLFLIGLTVTNLSMQEKGGATVRAAQVGESMLADWKGRPYSEVLALSGQPGSQQTVILEGREYVCTLTVDPLQPAASNPGSRVLLMNMNVAWQEQTVIGDGGTKTTRDNSLDLQSIMSPGGSL